MKNNLVFVFVFVFVFVSCSKQKKQENKDMWGATTEQTGSGSTLQLDDIIQNGELIMVTLSGPQTYYEYHGQPVGLHYLLCNEFCKQIGVSVRIEVCKDTSEVYRRLQDGDADLAALPFKTHPKGLEPCGAKASKGKWHWLANQKSTSLVDSINSWLTSTRVEMMQKEENFLLSTASVTRHVYSPFLDRGRGVISSYDYLFQKYASVARYDWRLLAAQCYQESTFDPKAHSWAGACGLMQIMPSTAGQLGLAQGSIYDPEQNVSAAARYIAILDAKFNDVNPSAERIKYVLASYNGGAVHVRDAMALARKYGKSPYRWNDVREFILKLQQPAFYNDPVVKNGYMRGSETFNYVESIYARWMDYRGAHYTPARLEASHELKNSGTQKHSGNPEIRNSVDPSTPHPSNKGKKKYAL